MHSPADLVTQHDRLTRWYASRYAARGLEWEDAYQESCLAIWRAALKYDPSRPDAAPFSAFARSFLIRALDRQLAKHAEHGFTHASDVGSRERVDLDQLESPEPDTRDGISEAIAEALDVLDSRSRAIVVRRYGLDNSPPWSVIECSVRFGLSVSAIKILIGRARSEIGEKLQSAGWDPRRFTVAISRPSRIKIG